MLNQREEKLTGIFLALIFAYTALYLINPFSGLYHLIIPHYFFKKTIFARFFLWTLVENIKYYLLNFLLAFYLSLYFSRIKSSVNNLPVLAYILFNSFFSSFILLETYSYSSISPLEMLGLAGEVVSIIIAACSAYLGWKISFIIFKKRKKRLDATE